MVQKKHNNIFHRFLIQKLINIFNKRGKKVIAQAFVRNIFLKLKLGLNKNPILLFLCTLKKLKPYVELIRIRKSGKSYEVPVPLKKKRQIFLAFSWFVSIIKKQKNKNSSLMFNRYAKEICKVLLNRGLLINHKRSLIKKSFENRAYSHFRWS